MHNISRIFSATRTKGSYFAFFFFFKSEVLANTTTSALGVFQGRRMLTRLIINSCVENTMPRDSMLLDRHHFPGKWGTVSDTTGEASETCLRVENCL